MIGHVCFAAYGVVDIESMGRHARRNYIRTVREELSKYGIELYSGGQKNRPYYLIQHKVDITRSFASNTVGSAFKDVMTQAIEWLPPEVVGAPMEE